MEKKKRKQNSITVLWAKFCLLNLHVDTAKNRAISNLKRGSQVTMRSFGGPNPGWLAPLESGGHMDAARCARRLGCLPARAAPGAESSPASDGADSAGTPDAKPAAQDRPACVCRLQQPRWAHTHSPPRRASQGGRHGDSFIAACSFTRKTN